MKKSVLFFLATQLVVLLFCGSARSFSPIDVLISKKNGEDSIGTVYPVTRYQAWVIALAVLQGKETNSIEAHYEENYVLTSLGPEDCPCRTEIGVWVESVSKNLTKVTIVTKGRVHKNDFTNIRTFPDTVGPDFHKKFETEVQNIMRGGELPVISTRR